MGSGMFDGLGCLAVIGVAAIIFFVLVVLPLAGWWLWNNVQVQVVIR